MANVGYATLQIIPSAKGFVPALEAQVAPSMTKVGGTAGKNFSGGFSSQLKNLAGPIAAAVSAAAVGSFFKGAVQGASNLAETTSKVNVIFGESSRLLINWSKDSAKAFGMSSQQALDAASSYAIFAQSAGLTGDNVVAFSTKLTGLASDFGSFYNTSPEEAITAISAALRGESEPIRKYNILLNEAGNKAEALKMGLIKTTTEALTPQQRVLAVYNQILAQSGQAQGDFARTAGGVANQGRTVAASFANLQASIGTVFLPTIQLLQRGLIGIFDAFAKIPGPVLVFIGVFAGVITAFVTGRIAVTLFKSAMIALNTAIKANVLLLIVTTLIALGAAIVAAYMKSESFRKIVNKAFLAVAKVVGTVVGYVVGYVSTLIKVYTKAITAILGAASHLPIVGKAAAAANAKVKAESKGITDSLDKVAKSSKKMVTGFAQDMVDKMPKIAKAGAKATNDALPVLDLAGLDLGGGGETSAQTAAKTKAAAMKSLPTNIGGAFIKAVQGSQDQIKAAFEKLAANVKDIGNKKLVAAVADTQKKILALATKRDALSEQYKTAKEQLSSLKDEAASYVKSVTDAVVASGNISNGRSFTNMVKSLTQSVTKAKEFNKVITGLKAAGLNNDSLKQLVEAGPASGLKAAKALLASGTGGVAIVNDLAAQLKSEGDGIGKTVAGSIYDAATAEAESAVKKIGDDLTTIENQIVSVAAAFAKEIAKIGKVEAPAWLSDLAAVTKNTVPKTVAATASPKLTVNGKTGAGTKNGSNTGIVVNNYNPVAEPSSITISRTMAKLALIGLD